MKLREMCATLPLLAILITFSNSLMGQEIIYECQVRSRLVAEDGVGSVKEETFPTEAQKAADANRGLLKIIPGKQKASREISLELLGGTFFHAFKHPNPHPNGDHIVFRYSHPVTKQMSYQIFPVGMPRFEFSIGHKQQRKLDGVPEDPYEHYGYCALKGIRRYGFVPLDIDPSNDEFSCSFTMGSLDSDYNELDIQEPAPFIYHYNQGQPPFRLFRTTAMKDKALEIKFSNLGPIGQKSFGHKIDFSDFLGWGQRWLFNFDDYLVDPTTLKPTGERILNIHMRLVNPVNVNPDNKDNVEDWSMGFYDLNCVRQPKPPAEEEKQIDLVDSVIFEDKV